MSKPRRRRILLIAALCALIVLVGGGSTSALAARAQPARQAYTAHLAGGVDDAAQAVAASRSQLSAAVATAQFVLDDSRGKVADERSRTDLRTMLDTGRTLLATPGAALTGIPKPRAAADLWALSDQMNNAATALAAGQQRVVDDQAAWRAARDASAIEPTATPATAPPHDVAPAGGGPSTDPASDTTVTPPVPPTVNIASTSLDGDNYTISIRVDNPSGVPATLHIACGGYEFVRSIDASLADSYVWQHGMCAPGNESVWLT